jgi:hypothetical protein
LVLELLAGRAEVLFSYGSAHAIGGHLAFNETFMRARLSAAQGDGFELFDGR